MDRIDEWRVFVTVATERSFARAARSHGRSPQAITRAVHALEARLGTRLLHRTTRSVSITSDGERYLAQARRVLPELELLEGVATRAGEVSGRVAITAPALFGQLHVMPIVTELLGKHPSLDARVVLLDRTVSLADEGIDVAVRIGMLPDSTLQQRMVGHVSSLLCATPTYLERAGTPRTPDAITRHSCIGFGPTASVPDRWTVGKAKAKAIAVHTRVITNTAQSAIEAALAHLGIVRVMSYQVASLLAAGKLRVVLANHQPPPVPVHIVHLPGIQSRAAVAFTELASTRLIAKLRNQ